MKRIYTILAAVLIAASVFLPHQVNAQAPEKMTYQAVIRNSSDQLVSNQGIGMQISILQTTATGTEVYVETQTATTNANGLVSIEIGIGTSSDDFSAIDWSSDIYFIKTETDPTTAGGTNYTITGTSQLLSVPYALHAKTAETVTVGQTISRTGLTVTLTNGGTYQDSINTYTAGDGIDITNNVISEHKYQIGDFAQGGIIFWLDETGEHGLVCAKSDQDGGSGIRWHAGTNGNTQAKGDGPYAGEANTSIIIAAQVAIGDNGSTYAARVCNELQITEGGKTYGDWYLPSKEELNLMYQNKSTIDATATSNGGSAFATNYYWSSTEYSNASAWAQYFDIGLRINNGKDLTNRVRAVRAF